MAVLCGGLLRSGRRFLSVSALLARNVRVCGRAAGAVNKPCSQNLYPTTTVAVRRSALATGPSLSFSCSSGRPCVPVFTHTCACPARASVLRQCGLHFFHTSAPRRALPASVILMILKPLQKLAALLVGRRIKKWWISLPASRRLLLREWAYQHRWHLVTGVGVAVLIIALLILTHLDNCPLTGRRRILVFNREDFIQLADATSEAHMEEFAEQLVPVTDPRHQVVERVVQHLAQRNKDIPQVSEITWSSHVVQSPAINAFVLPNGKVFVFTGMLEAVADIHQLTIILGHEMAHAILEHAAERASLSHVVDLLSVVLLTAIWALSPSDSLAMLQHWVQEKLEDLIFNRPYNRKLETEADEVGLQLAAKACADVRAGPVFWQQMDIRDHMKGGTLPEWLSTHPSHRKRIAEMDRLIPQALELRESCVCPSLPDVDPRVTFSKSVHSMLEKNHGAREPERDRTPLQPHSPTSLPKRLPGALLAQSSLLSSPNVDQLRKGSIPADTPETTEAAPVPEISAAKESQESSSPQGG
ncbi:metalloendopeptidase OMA1, mitochondrial [Pholidichthys leucotaenia]